MNIQMRKYLKYGFILATLAVVTLIAIFWSMNYSLAPQPFMDRRPRYPPPGDIELYYTVKTVISTVNVTLLAFLLATYIDIYRRVKSSFTIGLIIFCVVLLLYAFSANPIVHMLFGFRATMLGPFAMLSDLFACVALTVLLILTFKY
ncbi:hypothetical protein KEJ23_07100 [Candidatus Bathyarchaeota archaeon]|nr:hypothetical protein [Candidatus Bathyarchaeota archaeon]